MKSQSCISFPKGCPIPWRGEERDKKGGKRRGEGWRWEERGEGREGEKRGEGKRGEDRNGWFDPTKSLPCHDVGIPLHPHGMKVSYKKIFRRTTRMEITVFTDHKA